MSPLLGFTVPVRVPAPCKQLRDRRGEQGEHEVRANLEKQLLLMGSSGTMAAGRWWELVVELKAVSFQACWD